METFMIHYDYNEHLNGDPCFCTVLFTLLLLLWFEGSFLTYGKVGKDGSKCDWMLSTEYYCF